jgi:capsid protein
VLDKDEVKAIPAGWELNAPPSEHPTANYPPFIKSVAREYASGLGFTYEALFNDRESVNYGSLRGGMQMDQRFVRQLQADEAFELLIPIRLRWLKNSMLKGFATNGREGILLPQADWNLYTRTAFDFEPGEWIDPLKDVQAIAMQLEKKLTSHTEVSRRFGKRWADVAQRIADDMKLAKAKGFSLDMTPGLAQQLAYQTAQEDAAEAAATTSGGGKDGS